MISILFVVAFSYNYYLSSTPAQRVVSAMRSQNNFTIFPTLK